MRKCVFSILAAMLATTLITGCSTGGKDVKLQEKYVQSDETGEREKVSGDTSKKESQDMDL